MGPLWVLRMASEGPAVLPFLPGYPTKVRVYLTERPRTRLTLRGWRCRDQTPLRFWYRDRLPFASVPVSRRALETTGDLVAAFPARSVPADYTGYMLFSSAGRWNVQVRGGARVLGNVVLELAS